MSSRITFGCFGLGLLALTSCASHLAGEVAGQSSAGSGGSGGQATSTTGTSTGASGTGGAATGGASGAGTSSGTYTGDPADGTPDRQACTGNFGTSLSATHGRMDGYLVSIVQPGGSHACNA